MEHHALVNVLDRATEDPPMISQTLIDQARAEVEQMTPFRRRLIIEATYPDDESDCAPKRSALRSVMTERWGMEVAPAFLTFAADAVVGPDLDHYGDHPDGGLTTGPYVRCVVCGEPFPCPSRPDVNPA